MEIVVQGEKLRVCELSFDYLRHSAHARQPPFDSDVDGWTIQVTREHLEVCVNVDNVFHIQHQTEARIRYCYPK